MKNLVFLTDFDSEFIEICSIEVEYLHTLQCLKKYGVCFSYS